MSRAVILLLAGLCSAATARAGVLVVDASGGGEHLTPGAAVAVALDGDTIYIRAGHYTEPGLVILDGKTLSVVGENPGYGNPPIVEIEPGLLVRNVPAGKQVMLQNLTLLGAPASPPGSSASLVLRDSVGHVRLQSCRFFGGDGTVNSAPHGLPGIDAMNCLSVALVACLARGGEGRFGPMLGDVCGEGGHGILKQSGQFLIYDSTMYGGDGGSDAPGGCGAAGAGGAGLRQEAGSLIVVGSYAMGGDGGIAFNGGDAGHGFSLGFTGAAQLMGGVTASAGSAGIGDSGSNGKKGVGVYDPNHVSTNYGGTKRGFQAFSPVTVGGPGFIELVAPANEHALVFYSFSLQQLPLPGYQGVLMLATASMLGPLIVGPPGDFILLFDVPLSGTGLEALDVHVQPAYVGPAGIFLGPARVVTILDI